MSAVLKPHTWFEPMTEDALDSVMQVERRIYPFPWTWGNFRDSIRSGYYCVLYRGNTGETADGLIGYGVVLFGAGEAHLLNLSIAEACQGRGHGARLLEHVISVATARHAQMLFLEVRPSNEAARRLYARRGFRRIGVRRDYYPAEAGREDAIVLSLELPAPAASPRP